MFEDPKRESNFMFFKTKQNKMFQITFLIIFIYYFKIILKNKYINMKND